ncbi:MAG: thioredoxin family protein [Ignavibacteriaceae bacterium]|nr:thioredoxin family protein [Ignavibacteriaceae bacterium]
MKNLLLILFFSFVTLAQTTNQCVIDQKSGKAMLVGICDREAFKDTSFAWWFNAEYENYNLDKETLTNVKMDNEFHSITIVMGTWCSDSRREVPRFYKILDSLNFPPGKVKLIMVDRKKEAGEMDISSLKIELVPTIIFYNDGLEVGRIIETPKETLEKDLAAILAKK